VAMKATVLCARISALALALGLAGCDRANIPWTGTNEVFAHGFIADGRVDQIKPGMSVDTVLTTLGTPSTVSTVGNKTFYYISQITRRRVQFMQDSEIERRVFTVYFNQGFKVERVANYGLEDGKVFDFINRTTPTGGTEPSFIRNLLLGIGRF